MIRELRQWFCAWQGHPHLTTTVPIVGKRPGDPDRETTFCTGCGAVLAEAWTDSAGTEHFEVK